MRIRRVSEVVIAGALLALCLTEGSQSFAAGVGCFTKPARFGVGTYPLALAAGDFPTKMAI